MPTTASQIKNSIDAIITTKTQPYSINNVDVGELLKDIMTFIDNKQVEVIQFSNQSVVSVAWTDDRKIKFGAGTKIVAELLGDDGVYRQTASIQVSPDNITNTMVYTVDLGGSGITGRLLLG